MGPAQLTGAYIRGGEGLGGCDGVRGGHRKVAEVDRGVGGRRGGWGVVACAAWGGCGSVWAHPCSPVA